MNNFYKKTKQLFPLFLSILLNGFLHAITYNNRPLNTIIQPEEMLVLACPEDIIIKLDMENGNLNISTMNISEVFTNNQLLQNLEEIRSCSVKLHIFDKIANVISHKNAHILTENIELQAKTLLSLKNCLLEAPYLSIIGDRMIFDECFLINPQILQLSTNSLNSNYQNIQILFYDKPINPTFLIGNVDFLSSPMKKELYLINVKEIKVEFKPQAWNNS